MPRDNMASLIQRVARQARITFRSPAGPAFGENLHRLQQLLDEVRAEDLHLAPRGPSAAAAASGGPPWAGVVPPVSYMHICETESFSMGVFLLRSGACIPLHDHPGMNGMLKVLYGTLRIACMDTRVARQARITFRSPAGPAFGENLHRLQQLLDEVRAEDLHLAPRGPSAAAAASGGPPWAGVVPPVSYMHICETESFSMGVFLLRSGACIPLHDHPGMNGMLKVLYGTLRIACMDTVPAGAAAAAPPPPAAGSGPCLRALFRSRQNYTPASPPCLLSPHTDNLHQIDAVDGPAAFLDILAPPYDPQHGRDCHYYRLLEGPPAGAEPPALPREVWLVETPQAADFWCGGEPYPGPRVCL
ncbi:hypothetical protein HGM15179_005721 [Zosterops borbonicus]|uniref:2-aminoethanethiol dioxygenase n=1 Tax=Zosterops borbonicus TaxID=364589 RepID=A0A8K1GNV3_9PASS|nr:hypothetical protein HGM15179_005721 [Zosterops borbonicus]